MDRNTITGLVLIALLIIVWAYFFAPQPKPQDPKSTTQPNAGQLAKPDSLKRAGPQAGTADSSKSTTAASTQLSERFGSFATAASGQAATVQVTTDKLQLTVNTRGGALQPVQMREFKTYGGEPYPAFAAGGENRMGIQFRHGSRIIDTRELYYTPSTSTALTVTGEATQTLSLRAEVAPGKYLEHNYTFTGNSYEVAYQFRTVGLGEIINNNSYELYAVSYIPVTEKSAQNQRNETTVYYNYSGDIETLKPTSEEREQAQAQGNIKWVAFRTQFFSTAFLPEQGFEALSVSSELTNPPDAKPPLGSNLKRMEAIMQVPYRHGADESLKMKLFYGPNDLYVMEKVADGFERQVELGWGIFGWINRWVVLPVFHYLEQATSNYGIIIILLAMLIKLCLLPLTYRSYLSTAKMQVVNSMEEVKEMDAKYADDPVKLQNAKMQFYSSAGVSPFAGCIPLLLQLPILGAMFSFFPRSIDLRQQPFLWAEDLSAYDSILQLGFAIPFLGSHISGFAVLMTLSQVAYTWVSQRGQTMTGPAAQMQFLGYVMPFIFFFVLNSYSAGLSWYYLAINIITIVQTFVIQAFVDKNKLHAQIEKVRADKKKGGTKTSGLAGWVERQQKKQQELLRERSKARRAGK